MTFFLDTLVLGVLRALLWCSLMPGVEPLRTVPRSRRGLGVAVCRRGTSVAEAVDLLLSRIDLPIRRFVLLSVPAELVRPRAMPDLAAAETDGSRLPIEPPMREVLVDDVPTFEVRRELAASCLFAVETDGLSILIELLMYVLEPEGGRSILIERLPDEDADGVLVLMEPPIRALLLGPIRTPELLLIEVEPVELLLIEILDEGLREAEEPEGLETMIRLDVEPPGLLRVCVVPERVGAERLIDILLEPLRLGIERLDEIELERLGLDRLTDILLELLRLGTDRLEVIVLDRLGDLLTDVLLEVLRLGTDRLRLADMELDRLGAGARLGAGGRLTDDLLELLRLGVAALAGGAGLAACALWLELRELEPFLEALAAMAGSAARATSQTKHICRRTKPGNRDLFV